MLQSAAVDALTERRRTRRTALLKIAPNKSIPTKWHLEFIWATVIFLGGMAVVYGTALPNDLGLLLICLWLSHVVTAWVWKRRMLKAQREAREAPE